MEVEAICDAVEVKMYERLQIQMSTEEECACFLERFSMLTDAKLFTYFFNRIRVFLCAFFSYQIPSYQQNTPSPSVKKQTYDLCICFRQRKTSLHRTSMITAAPQQRVGTMLVIPNYGRTHSLEDDAFITTVADDVYNTFYRSAEEEAKVAKARDEEAKLSLLKEQFLAMVEKSEKAEVRDYTNLAVSDEMLEYVYEKYGSKWTSKDEIANVILEDLWLKYGKDDKGKGKVFEDTEHHKGLKVNKGKEKVVDDNGKGKDAEHHHLKMKKGLKRNKGMHMLVLSQAFHFLITSWI